MLVCWNDGTKTCWPSIWIERVFAKNFVARFYEKNDTWNIRRLDDKLFVPSVQPTIELYCRLTDFWPIVPFHSVLFLHKWVSWFCCELSLLFNVFYVIVHPTTFYTSLLFLTDHGFWNYFYAFCIFFTLAFGTDIPCTNLDMASLV